MKVIEINQPGVRLSLEIDAPSTDQIRPIPNDRDDPYCILERAVNALPEEMRLSFAEKVELAAADLMALIDKELGGEFNGV